MYSHATTVVASFNRYWSGLRPSKLGKSIEIRSEMMFSDSQRAANGPMTCTEGLEHVPIRFQCRSGRYTIENLPKTDQISSKSMKSIQNPTKSSKSKQNQGFRKKIEIFFSFDTAKTFLDPPGCPRLFLMSRQCIIINFNKKKYNLEVGSLKFQPGEDRGDDPKNQEK